MQISILSPALSAPGHDPCSPPSAAGPADWAARGTTGAACLAHIRKSEPSMVLKACTMILISIISHMENEGGDAFLKLYFFINRFCGTIVIVKGFESDVKAYSNNNIGSS